MSHYFDHMEKTREFLASHGLVVDALDCSGGNARCGTTDAPRSKNGWYRFHLDDSPVVTCINYNDGEGGQKHTLKLYAVEEWKKLTEAEREERREAFRQSQKKALAELGEKRKKAASKAEWHMKTFSKAGEGNGYLKRKGVLPFGELRQMTKGHLVVPMYDVSGKLVSVQKILPEKPEGDRGDKFFLKDGEVEGCYFPIPAHDDSAEGPLLLAEGYATAASLRMATGFEVWAAFNAGNLEPLARAARAKYPAREILLCADNDCTDKQGNPRPKEKNTGVCCATKAAQVISAKLAVCPAINGRKADFNDLHTATDDGLERVRVCIEKARKEASPLSEEWGVPVPFSAHRLPLLEASYLPPVLGDFCVALAEEKQVPVEIAVAMSLATLATAAQGRYVVRIREGYTEPLNLYTICPLEPANRKSATVEACIAPLKEWERSMAEAMGPMVREARSRRLTIEKAIESKRTKAGHSSSMEQLLKLQGEINELESQLPEIPQIPRLLADNTTPEALAVLMENMNGSIAIITAEGGIFDILAGMYSQGKPNLDLFLKGHSGDSFRVDRRSASPILLEHPCLTLGISPQPVTLAERSASKAFRGRGLDGRFLYFMPESLLGRRKLEPQLMPPAVRARFHNGVRGLLPSQWSADTPDPVTLELSKEAYQLWLAFYGEVERGLAKGGEFEGMNDWGGKLAGAVARIAGLFHLISHERPERLKVGEDTMQQALYLGSLLAEHAKAAYALMGTDESIENAKKVLEWIRRQAAESFSTQDCWQAMKSTFHHMPPLKEALRELVDRGFIREAQAKQGVMGRPPAPSYQVNPATLRG